MYVILNNQCIVAETEKCFFKYEVVIVDSAITYT